jgi:2-polyprenyl-3-methyl-5-hydroxy-6-metoxy-1,4-benzoquinol methylase
VTGSDPRALARRLSDNYFAHYFSMSREFSARHYESLVPTFRSYFGRLLPTDRTAQILDVACGCGEFLYFLQRQGYVNTSGVDVTPQQVAIAARAGVRGIVVGDAFDFLAARPKEYDLVSVHDFIEHVPQNRVLDLLDLAHRALRPGGTILLSTVNAESLFGARTRYVDFTHQLSFTPASLEFVLRAAGFTDVVIRPKEPVVHGLASAVRFVLWKAIKQLIRLYFLVETCSPKSSVFTEVMYAKAVKAGA